MEKCTTGPFLQFEKASTVALVHFLEPVLPSSQCGPRAGEIWTRTMSHSVWRFVVPRIPRAGTIWDRLGKKGGAHDDESLGSFHARDAPLFEGSGIPIVYILGGKDGARGAERHSGGENGQESCGAVNRRRSFLGDVFDKGPALLLREEEGVRLCSSSVLHDVLTKTSASGDLLERRKIFLSRRFCGEGSGTDRDAMDTYLVGS